MRSWPCLRHLNAAPTDVVGDDLAEAPALLSSGHALPLLLPALLDAAEAADIASAPGDRRWFATSSADAAARLHALAIAIAADPFLAALWESLPPMAQWLSELPRASTVIVDLSGAGAADHGAARAGVAEAAAAFLDLRCSGDPHQARALLPSWLARADIAAASLAARRFHRVERPREALLAAAFGSPVDASRWQPWLDAGPIAPALPDALDEASRLATVLVDRGLMTVTDSDHARKWVPTFLTSALRTRSAHDLLEIVEILYQQRLVSHHATDLAALTGALAAFDA
jgi:hypothetical protein